MDKAVSQYATDALRLVGHMVMPGRFPEPEALQEVTGFLNQMLDSWNTCRNAIYSIQDLTFPLTAGQFQYTIGPGGQINTARPTFIQRANLIYETAPTVERLPIEIINVDQWSVIRLPQLESAIPLQLYYDRGYSQSIPTGQGLIYLWPAPQAAYQLELFLPALLPTVLGTADTIFAPPGYARAITYNLGLEIMPAYGENLTQQAEMRVEKIAREARQWVDALNAQHPITQIDPALVNNRNTSFNWLVSVT